MKTVRIGSLVLIAVSFVAWASAGSVVLCSGHRINSKFQLFRTPLLQVPVLFNDEVLPASKNPVNMGKVVTGQVISLKVYAFDKDDHVCDVAVEPHWNLIQPTSVTVTITTKKGTPVDTVVLEGGPSVPEFWPLWSKNWTVPASLAGEKLVFTYNGIIDDVLCNVHGESTNDFSYDLKSHQAEVHVMK
jgi:hypothetical protein